jgi:hypothetical protein
MKLPGFGAAVVLALALAGLGGTERERPMIPTATATTAELEAAVATHPSDCAATLALAQQYLDAHLPGLAVALVKGSPAAVRGDVRAQHVFARALIDAGRNADALDAEQRVVVACRALADGSGAAAGCSPNVLVSAIRRTAILRELLSLGVEDARAHPEAALVAYQNATREARLTLE